VYKLLRVGLLIIVLVIAGLTALVLASVPFAWLFLLVFVVFRYGRRGKLSDAHGSARWAAPRDVPHMLEGHGLFLGHMSGRASKPWAFRSLFSRHLPPKEACRRFLAAFWNSSNKLLVRLTNAVHIAIFAPTGVGKGVSIVIPHLLMCRDAMVVIDPKGENFTLTAKARRAMGHRVVVLDPFHVVTREPDTFNPLDFIDPESRTAIDDCRDLAEALVVRAEGEKEPHWADSAELWIAAMTALLVSVAKGDDKSLQAMRILLTNPNEMQTAITMMCQSDAMDGMLARLGHQLTQFKDKELTSTLTTTNRFLRFLDTGAVAHSTRRSTFDPADLLKGKMTVYLVLPPDRIHAQAGLLRLWIGSMLRVVVKGGLQRHNKVQFILEEAASLGSMTSIDDAVDKYRGYGVRLLFLYQSLGQLKKCFPEGQEQTLLSNVTQIFFGVSDQQTAEYVSSRLGEATIVTESGGTNHGYSTQQSHQGETTSYSSGSSNNWQYMGRRLLKPEEVATLDERTAITFAPGLPPIATRLVRYYEKNFKKLDGPGPVAMTFHVVCLVLAVTVISVMILAVLASH
jgi:type IV secretion system protein VirD4